MKRSITLHCGLHKTGTSSLQHELFSVRDLLKADGVLYPELSLKKRTFKNHSIPFYSLFSKNPATYHVNRRLGLEEAEEIELVHATYKAQLTEQIKNFKGKRILISGEDISALELSELQHLKSFFSDLAGLDTSFKILLFLRHPVSYANSMVQERLKQGVTFENAVNEQLNFSKKGIIKIIDRFEACFGRKNIDLFKFEDAVNNPDGLTGAFFKAASLNSRIIKHIEKVKLNLSISKEASILLSSINSESNQDNSLPTSANSVYNINLQRLIELPGQNFSMSTEFQETVWENSFENLESICNRYSLKRYQAIDTKNTYPGALWHSKSIHYLFRWIHRQPFFIRKKVIQTLRSNISKNRPHFGIKKGSYLFVMTTTLALYVNFLQIIEKPARRILKRY